MVGNIFQKLWLINVFILCLQIERPRGIYGETRVNVTFDRLTKRSITNIEETGDDIEKNVTNGKDMNDTEENTVDIETDIINIKEDVIDTDNKESDIKGSVTRNNNEKIDIKEDISNIKDNTTNTEDEVETAFPLPSNILALMIEKAKVNNFYLYTLF